MSKTFIYVVDRDFGFAPNPFHGLCTLATCKPRIRSAARPGDWIFGIGGRRLNATGKCIFAMQVDRRISFQSYWSLPEYQLKKPLRNGSATRLVGDNIYNILNGKWVQADSHHSNEDGTANMKNLIKDTGTDAVLVSSNFYYFGKSAIDVPPDILRRLGYANARNHRTFSARRSSEIVEWIKRQKKNYVHADPFDFIVASARYSGTGSKVILPND